ncbi:hypothetical protein [Jannaschia sp. W003]|uniref:ribbon-helix-helix domain-containing protein n=1 Tax=Jannaschia sp. W003 TaxID=2867012 RepID=UPI0021A57614|nr:hypothetical protein [Jannaschia sp. W003]UWQ22231.1 hypothetical protein K3554_04145 [Jannaschia sp. W003]
MTVKLSISLTDQQADYARRQVEEGRFPSTSAVIQQALETKRREDEEYAEWKAEFVAMMRRRAEGTFLPADEFRSRVEAMLSEEARRLGVDG